MGEEVVKGGTEEKPLGAVAVAAAGGDGCAAAAG